MAAKRKTTRRAKPRRRARPRKAGRLGKTWKDTRAALTSAEATVQKRVRALVKRSGVDTRQVTQALKQWTTRLDRERKGALKQLEARLAQLQTRARKERRSFARTADGTVRRALAALNIPSRNEVHQLTKRVEELSRKIDRFRR
jgi:Poly(hydroxyalcanoate) granule associated protein (phasin)